ncbi:MAG TPA: sugar phosphate isomerase/epimerase [Ruminococcaceae bacterium]|nr:sugar phosphate isomerase/epimerase [Oscillospiraceae bacterium]
MEVGISTACLYPLETVQALSSVLDQGARTVEIFVNADHEYSIPYLRRMQAVLTRADAEVFTVHPYTAAYESLMFFSDYTTRFEDSVEQYRRTFASAAFLGAKAVVFHGARKEALISMEEYCERYGRLASVAREEGVVLAQENVCRCKSGSIKNITTMRRLLGDEVRFILDVKQARRAGIPAQKMCSAMEGQIVGIHLSDSAPGHDCLLPGFGEADLPGLHRELQKQRFRGVLLIEVYRTGFSAMSEMKKALSVARLIFSPNNY